MYILYSNIAIRNLLHINSYTKLYGSPVTGINTGVGLYSFYVQQHLSWISHYRILIEPFIAPWEVSLAYKSGKTVHSKTVREYEMLLICLVYMTQKPQTIK